MKISVIVPVYNVEQYLQRCIDSILAQTFPDFELLLIDDGSTDKSGVVCDEYAKKDERVRVFHKENGGVSSARNLGIAESSGGWLCFVDSDDTVTPQYLSCFANSSRKHPDVELFVVGFNHVSSYGRKEICLEAARYERQSFYKAIIYLRKRYNALGVPWNKMYSKDVIRRTGLSFDETLNSYEDELFVLQYVQSIKNMVLCPDVTYNYRVNLSGNSLSTTFIEISHHIWLAHRLEAEGLKISANVRYVRHCRDTFVFHLTESICRLYEQERLSDQQRLDILQIILSESEKSNCNTVFRRQMLRKGVLLYGGVHIVDIQMKICYPLFSKVKLAVRRSLSWY